jgi:hypothetical protein
VYLKSNLGSVVVRGGQLRVGGAPNARGVMADTCEGNDVLETIIDGCGGQFPYQGVSVTGSIIRPKVQNHLLNVAAAVQLTSGCTRNEVNPAAKGDANRIGLGVQLLGTTNTKNSIDTTRINPACLSGGASNKLQENALSITAVGVTAQGNTVMGVPN